MGFLRHPSLVISGLFALICLVLYNGYLKDRRSSSLGDESDHPTFARSSASVSPLNTQKEPGTLKNDVRVASDEIPQAPSQAEKLKGLLRKLDTSLPDYSFAQSMVNNFAEEPLQIRHSYLNHSGNNESYIGATDIVPQGTKLAAIYISSCLSNRTHDSGQFSFRSRLGQINEAALKNTLIAVPIQIDGNVSADRIRSEIMEDPCLAGVTENPSLTI